jgi:hypothetical protein
VPDDIKRRTRIIMNNLENVPVDLALFWAAFVSVLAQSLAGGGKRGRRPELWDGRAAVRIVERLVQEPRADRVVPPA